MGVSFYFLNYRYYPQGNRNRAQDHKQVRILVLHGFRVSIMLFQQFTHFTMTTHELQIKTYHAKQIRFSQVSNDFSQRTKPVLYYANEWQKSNYNF